MKQPERSNENLSWSKVNTGRLNFDRTARIYAALAALLFVFVFSLSNATGASGPQTNQPNARQGEVVLDGIRYSPITNDKGQTIYVPTIATPEYIAKTIEENIKLITDFINGDLKGIYEEEPIEELTIEPNLEQKLTAYLFLAAENDGDAVPKTMEELEELERRLGDPIILTYRAFKVENKDGRIYLVPRKIYGYDRDTYGAGIKIEKPKRGPVCDAEYDILIEKNPEGKRTVEIDTTERGLGFTKLAERFVEKQGIEGLPRGPYVILEPLIPIQERMIIHGCVIKDIENPKKATTYLSAPIYRTY